MKCMAINVMYALIFCEGISRKKQVKSNEIHFKFRDEEKEWNDPRCRSGSHFPALKDTSTSDGKVLLIDSVPHSHTHTHTHTQFMLPTQKYIPLSGHNGNNKQLPGGSYSCYSFNKDVVTQILHATQTYTHTTKLLGCHSHVLMHMWESMTWCPECIWKLCARNMAI